jgi:hypothetical protein
VAGHVAGAEKKRNSYIILVWGVLGEKKPGRPRLTWKNSIDGEQAFVKIISNLVFHKRHISEY